MAGYSNAGKAALLSGFASAATYVSLHSADPGSTGTSELTGGTPAYARQSITWAAPSAGSLSSSNQPTWQVPGSSTVAYVGFWSAATGGTFELGRALPNTEVYAGAGTYTLTSAVETVS